MKKTALLLTALLMGMTFTGCQKEIKVVIPAPIMEEPALVVEAEPAPIAPEEKLGLSMEEIEKLYEGNGELINLNRFFIGKKAPDLALVNMAGESVRLDDQMGEALILEFMASWCPTCQEVKPILKEYASGEDALKVLSVGVFDEMENIKAFAEEDTESYFMAADNDEVTESYLISFVPIFFFIDEAGIVQFVYSGDITTEILADYASTILGK